MTRPITPNTNIYAWGNYLLKTPEASFPFPGQIREMDFKEHTYKVIPQGYRVSDFFVDLGFSHSEFNRKLKAGAVYKRYYGWPWKKLYQDEAIEKGETDYRIKRLAVCIWLYDIKHTLKWYFDYFLNPVYGVINKITNRLFGRVWL